MQIVECVVPFPEDMELQDGRYTTLGMFRGEFIASDPLMPHVSWLVCGGGFLRIDVRSCVLPIAMVEVRSVLR